MISYFYRHYFYYRPSRASSGLGAAPGGSEAAVLWGDNSVVQWSDGATMYWGN